LEKSALRAWNGSQITGRIAVSVETDAPSDHLDVELGWTSCGLRYTDLIPCPPAELHIGRLQGRVVGPAGSMVRRGEDLRRHTAVPIDPAGPALADAEVLLVDPSGRVIERLKTDRSGEFASTRVLAGACQLLVRSAAFGTYRARVFAEEDVSRPTSLRIQLGRQGSCSAAARLQ
jgi:hypothetical protein